MFSRGLLIFLIAVLSLSFCGQVNAGDNKHKNGEIKRVGDSFYYPNGTLFKTTSTIDGDVYYYPNGRRTRSRSGGGYIYYYGNGQIIKTMSVAGGDTYYYPNGNKVKTTSVIGGDTYYYPNGQVIKSRSADNGDIYYFPDGSRGYEPPRIVRYKDGDWEYTFRIYDGAPDVSGFDVRINYGNYQINFHVKDGIISNVSSG